MVQADRTWQRAYQQCQKAATDMDTCIFTLYSQLLCIKRLCSNAELKTIMASFPDAVAIPAKCNCNSANMLMCRMSKPIVP